MESSLPTASPWAKDPMPLPGLRVRRTRQVFDALRQLMAPPRPTSRRIGFGAGNP
ncbi:MAG: hypothetical protein WBN92_18560 [Terriglobia bacterium]